MLHFSRMFLIAGALFALLMFLPGAASAQKKGKTTVTPASDADYLYLQSHKQMAGTVMSFDSGTDELTVRVGMPHYEPNPNYKPPRTTTSGSSTQARQMQMRQVQHYQKLQRDQLQAMRARTPQQKQQALRRIAQEMARFQQQQMQSYARLASQNAYKKPSNPAANTNNGPFRVVTVSKDYQVTLKENGAVRKTYLPIEFDDMGNYKVYTEKEKAALRGNDAAKPGFSATPQEIEAGAEVTLYLAAKRDVRPDDDLVGNTQRPIVNMIVLTKQAGATRK